MRVDRTVFAWLLCLIFGGTLAFSAINTDEPSEATTPPAGVEIRRTPPPFASFTIKQVPIRAQPLDSNESRLQYRWLKNHPVRVVAWRGEITGMEQTPDGIMVRVKVWPDVVPIKGKLVAHMDHFYETYLYANGALSLAGVEDPGPHSFFVPL